MKEWMDIGKGIKSGFAQLWFEMKDKVYVDMDHE